MLVIGSFSKAFAIPGWRLGYLAADPRLISDALRVQDAVIICPPAIAQYGMLAALAEEDEESDDSAEPASGAVPTAVEVP